MKSSLKKKKKYEFIYLSFFFLLDFFFYSNIVDYSIIGLNNLYLVTEFVPGGDLYSLLQNVGCLDEHSAKLYSLQVLYALRYLRQNGIIHRDIKPDNILISANGRLKLTDFGLSYIGMVDRQQNASASSFSTTNSSQTMCLPLAKGSYNKRSTFGLDSPPSGQSPQQPNQRPNIPVPVPKVPGPSVSPKNDSKANSMTLSGKFTSASNFSTTNGGESGDLKSANSLVGTPDYVAPEIILNQNHSFAVDYWSLGVMIYEMLYGIPPFHGENERETHRKILVCHVNFDSDPNVSLTPEAIDLIKNLLVVEPSHRIGYKNINEIIDHPWFKGVDPLKDEPPFIPQLGNNFDTGYFEQRYEFDGNEDASILVDLQEYIQPTTLIPDDAISSFPSVAIDQLGNANREIAEKISEKHSKDKEKKKRHSKRDAVCIKSADTTLTKGVHRRSISLSSEDSIADFVDDSLTTSTSFTASPPTAKPRDKKVGRKKRKHFSFYKKSGSLFDSSSRTNSNDESH